MKKNSKKENLIKSLISNWKKIDAEKRILTVIFIIIFAFIFLMPNLYKGWVNFRDNGFHFDLKTNGGKKDFDVAKTFMMTCFQSIQDNEYKTEIKTLIYYIDKELKKEDYTLTMTALNDAAKEDLLERKSLYDASEKTYQLLTGFTVKSTLSGNTFTYNLVTDYAAVDMNAVKKEQEKEEGQILVDLKYNQEISSVQSHYESLGLKCTK